MKHPFKFVVSETYEIITHESAEHADAAERGFNFRDSNYLVNDLASYISDEGFTHRSSGGEIDERTWLSTEPVVDYRDGSSTSRSLHFHGVIDDDGVEIDREQAEKLWRYVAGNADALSRAFPEEFDQNDFDGVIG